MTDMHFNSKFDIKLWHEICDLIADGQSLVQIANMEGMPCRATMNNWLRDADLKKEGFEGVLDSYTRAKREQADAIADDILDIADNADDSKEGVQKAKLRIDSRKWLAGKLQPKKYSEKHLVENSYIGADGEPTNGITIILDDGRLDEGKSSS